jgi:tryptophanyl-tRNA synthetase
MILDSQISKPIIFSGIQPSGILHLGNYLGAIKNWIFLQNSNNYNCFFSIADLHSLTVLALLISAGLSEEKSNIFLQSSVQAHSELNWILSCFTQIGWLNRMTQYKDKSQKDKDKSNSGLYFYPILQASDILLYNTDIVPVGQDQVQHIELTRDIASKFNSIYGNIFKLPSPQVISDSKIMSLKDSNKKMSKSDLSNDSKILLTDSNDLIFNKIKKAKTGSFLPKNLEELKENNDLMNLVNIYTLISNCNKQEVYDIFLTNNFSTIKTILADIIITEIEPIRKKYTELIHIENRQKLENILKYKINDIKTLSNNKLNQVKQVIGF